MKKTIFLVLIICFLLGMQVYLTTPSAKGESWTQTSTSDFEDGETFFVNIDDGTLKLSRTLLQGWTAVGESTSDRFGYSVASAGDVNGDGYDDVIVGAYNNDGAGSDAGEAYVYHGLPSGLSTAPAWSDQGEAAGDYFGGSVASAGDVNGDGTDDLIIGAEGYNSHTGRVYIYFGSSDGNVYALDAATGDIKWEFPTEDKIWSSPIIEDGVLYVGSFDKKLYALDAATGSKKWEPFETEGVIVSNPIIDNSTIYFGSFDRHTYAVSAADGRLKWEFSAEGAVATTPLVHDNTVYFGSLDRYLYAVDARDGSLRWKFMGENWFWAKPVVYDGVIYAGNLDGKVYALDAKKGPDEVGEFNLGSAVSSSPVVANNSIVFASQQGMIYAIDAGSNQLKQLAELEENIYGPLTASEGIVYIHTQDLTLHPVDVSNGAKLATISLKVSK